MAKKKVAVFLCGSGFLDGSEIRESVAVLWALNKLNVETHCFAPDDVQADVINCYKRQPMPEKRNMLVEAARIARSKILPLEEYVSGQFNGLAIPGGFGVAKNFCTFAAEGAKAKVRLHVKRAIEETFQAKKPILAVCIAPALLALALKDKAQLTMTLGPECEAAQEVQKLGHKTVVKNSKEFYVDETNRIITTPAYMHDDAELVDIFTGIDGAAGEFVSLL